MSWLRNNGLSIALLVLFVGSFAGHAVSGWLKDNDDAILHNEPQESFVEFITSAEFGESVFENWESEFLQMAMYVILTVFLRQKGSAESKALDGPEEVDELPEKHRHDPDAPWPVRRGGWVLTLYKNSLFIALFGLFLLSFVLHAAAGAREHAEELKLHHLAPVPLTTLGYMRTAKFWYESFQNWQSEFLSVFAIIMLSIYLRQFGSPQSKPVHAPHAKTGGGD